MLLDLESSIRHWVNKYPNITICSGGIFDPKHIRVIGNGVFVPTLVYKIVIRHTPAGRYDVLCYAIPNERTSQELQNYLVHPKVIEDGTQMRFFTASQQSRISHVNGMVISEYYPMGGTTEYGNYIEVKTQYTTHEQWLF